ncbi:hypothetical protein GCM10009641_69900 [Mycobacterium cookii]|uniref:DUF222 domain-containing protein n=1 Tax=Nocardioides furvisabuli TaxID=375542 RepID=A0ABN2WRK1_9ACTN|nr:hypothetical protein [Nocardioides furvisabuli]
MSDLATRTALPFVVATTKRLGATLPPKLAEALESVERLRTERRAFKDVPDITAAVAASILAGKDPLASKDVQRAAIAQQLIDLNIEHRLNEHAHQRGANALLEHADAVIDSWRPAVEKAEAALRRFRDLVPGVSPLDDGLPVGLPTQALTPWGEAREAAAIVEEVGKGWHALANLGAAYVGQHGRPIMVADLTYEQVQGLGTTPKCIDVIRLDVPIELASTTTYAERAARIAQGAQDHQNYEAAAPERAREERRQQMGVVMIP